MIAAPKRNPRKAGRVLERTALLIVPLVFIGLPPSLIPDVQKAPVDHEQDGQGYCDLRLTSNIKRQSRPAEQGHFQSKVKRILQLQGRARSAKDNPNCRGQDREANRKNNSDEGVSPSPIAPVAVSAQDPQLEQESESNICSLKRIQHLIDR